MRALTKWARDAQTSGPVAPNGSTFDAQGNVPSSAVAFLARPAALSAPTTKGSTMAVVTATPDALDELVGELDRQVEEDRQRARRLHVATLAAIDAVNIAVGELALALEPDDPRGPGLHLISGGLDELWRESGGPHLERERAARFSDRLGAALDRIGHQGSPIFINRLAVAFDEVA
jgi:hypothetical protein